MVQNLCVLAAEVKSGAVISPGEPSFEIFSQAARTIKSILDTSLIPAASLSTEAHDLVLQSSSTFGFDVDWDPQINFEPWQFESDFWESLATHPTIVDLEGAR